MSSYIQKKFSITHNHKKFLENYKNLGFSGQSGIVREALNLYIKDYEAKERKTLMAQKAQELVDDYEIDSELTAFTCLDGEDFHRLLSDKICFYKAVAKKSWHCLNTHIE